MSDIGATSWSETDASNTALPPNGWPEGMNPSDVNNSARAGMGALKRFWNRTNSTETTGGTNTAYTLTYDVGAASYYDGEEFSFIVNATCATAPTLNINALGAKNLRKLSGTAWGNLAAGDLQQNTPCRVRYNSGDDKFDVIHPTVASSPFPTGFIGDCIGASAPAGWIFAWGTIGDASSSATNRANADCEALFTLLWTDLADGQAPVSGGRGGSAPADWAAHKTIGVPDARGRARYGKDNMGGTAANRVTIGGSGVDGATLGAAGGDQSMQQHTHGVNDSGHTHVTNADNVGLGGSGGGNALWQSPSGSPVTSAPATTGISVQAAGAGSSQNMPPAMIVTTIIKL